MSTTRRWIMAIIMAVVLLAIFIPVFYVGFFLGGMATDSCSNLPNAAFLWLEVAWPITLLATALIGPILIIKQVRGRWVWISLAISLVVSACCYVGWFFPLLTLMC
jgi:hypothetical protein